MTTKGEGSSYDVFWNLLLWLIVPPMVAKFLLGQYYGLRYKNTAQRPRPESSTYQVHYQRVYAIVLLVYFGYCLVEAVRVLPATHYQTIGVHRQDVDRDLKSHFRQQIISLHPDKSPDADPAKFMHIKNVYEMLDTMETRIAYDCYGATVMRDVQVSSASLSGGSLKSPSRGKALLSDYYWRAFTDWAIFYVSTGVIFLLLSGFKMRHGLLWRAWGLVAFGAIELYVLMRPASFGKATIYDAPYMSVPMLASLLRWWNGIPTHSKLYFMRQLYMYGSMALGQIIGLFRKPSEDQLLKDLSTKLEGLSKGPLSKESDHLLLSSFEPLRENEEMRELLKRRMGRLTAEVQLYEMMSAAERRKTMAQKKPHNTD